jgi:hypothetical protein
LELFVKLTAKHAQLFCSVPTIRTCVTTIRPGILTLVTNSYYFISTRVTNTSSLKNKYYKKKKKRPCLGANTHTKRAGGEAQVVELLPSKYVKP